MTVWRRIVAGWRNRPSGMSVATAEPAAEPPQAAPHDGGLLALSARHASGWLRNLADPAARCAYEIVLPDSGEVLARGRANEFIHGLAAQGVGDGAHGFWTTFPRTLSEAERGHAVLRPVHGQGLVTASAATETRYEPVLHVAMDIVDNCNLRCPFCLYDYANVHATHFMTEATLEAALRFLPYVRDGEFWFSCLHEPTLHPQIMQFVGRVPREYGRKGFFTSNLAKRMPPAYFEWLAQAPLDHINISIESREPALYERMRKGARHHIFAENWRRLLAAFGAAESPPRIRYITMAYKSNLQELPALADYLLAEAQAWQVELRYTFAVPHIDPAFVTAEFLDADDWAWLQAQVAHLPADRLVLRLPPPQPDPAAAAAPAPAEPAPLPSPDDLDPETPLKGRYMFRLSWDGSLRVVGVLAGSRYDDARERDLLTTNVRDVGDPDAFLAAVAAMA